MKENSAAITLIIPSAPGIHLDILESSRNQTQPIHVVVEEGLNPSANRNRGAKKALTPLVAFSNGHTLLREDWAEKVNSFFQRHPDVDMIGGPQLNYANDSYFAQLSGDALACPFCTGNMNVRYRATAKSINADESSLTSANLICRRHVLDSVQFDERLYPGEDPKFITDVKSAGFKLAYSPDVVVYNRRRTTLLALGRQIFNYGAARVQKDSWSGMLRRPQFFGPAALLIYVLFLPFLAIWNFYSMAPLIVYMTLAVFFSTKSAMENRRPGYVLAMPFIFLWIHLSYGAGICWQFAKGGSHLK